MGYDFQAYLEAVGSNWYRDDELLQRLVARYAGALPEDIEAELSACGGDAAGPLRALVERSAQPENSPSLRHFDAYGRRVDEVVLPPSTLEVLAEVEGRYRLGTLHGDPYVFYAESYLVQQNGEAGVACSMACTDGLVRLLEALGERPEHDHALRMLRASGPERVWHAAQFVTEVQGGSDIPANETRAVRQAGGRYRLYGQKWFCSNINADWFVVTARPDGAPAGPGGVALFLVPAFREEGLAPRNGYLIERLKDKLGTRELATAEVRFDGAVAYPVGPLDRGIVNVVDPVLITSRLACVSAAAAFLRQAERVIEAYTEHRTAFGRRIGEYPLVREAVSEVRRARARSLSIFFELLRLREAPPGSEAALDFRLLLSLAKPHTTRESTRLLHEAMMVLGGNGLEEAFSPLPRIYRDSVVMETWEGPHNVLLVQALRDMARFGIDPAAFVERAAGPGQADLARGLERVLAAADDPEATLSFARLAGELVVRMGERLLAEAQPDR